jgi:hypothetical protein
MSSQLVSCVCGARVAPGDFCGICGQQASGGSGIGVLALVGWLFIPLLILFYPIAGVLGTLAMVAAQWIATLIGASDGWRLLAIAVTGYVALYFGFGYERAASRGLSYRRFRKWLRRAFCLALMAVGVLGGSQETGSAGVALVIILVVGAPLVFLLAKRFDRAFEVAGPEYLPARKPVAAPAAAELFWNRGAEVRGEPEPMVNTRAFHAGFSEHAIDGTRTGFAVVAGRAPNWKLALVLLVAFESWLLFGFDHNNHTMPEQYAIVAGLIVGGWLVYRFTKRWTAKPAEKYLGGQFVVSPQGIELPDARSIGRDAIADLRVELDGGSGRTRRVSFVLRAVLKAGGYPPTLAGGMDEHTAGRLLVAVDRALRPAAAQKAA